MDLGFLRRRPERRPYAANSTGRYRGSTRVKGIRASFYEAIGPARREFDEKIKEAIVSHINDNSDKLQCATSHLVLSLFMVGHSEDRTKPVVMFVSEDKAVRREAFHLIKDSGIMRDFRGFTLGEMSLKAEFEDLQSLGSEPNSTVNTLTNSLSTSFTAPNDPIEILAYQSWKGNYIQLKLKNADSSAGASATSGGIVSYRGIYFYQTVSHFHQSRQPEQDSLRSTAVMEGSDDECEIMDLSDLEDEDDRLARITSRGSETPPATQGDQGDCVSTTDSPSSRQSEDTISLPESFDVRDQWAARESPPQTRLKTPEVPEPSVSPPCQDHSLLVTGEVVLTSPSLDTSFIRVGIIFDIDDVIPLESYMDYVENVPTDSAIKGSTTRGEFSGTISGTPSFTCLPGSNIFQEVYTAKINEPLVPGDCGCWIRDAVTGKLFGHVIAGSPTTGLVLIMPATRVFSQLLHDISSQDPYMDMTYFPDVLHSLPLDQPELTLSMPSLSSGPTEPAEPFNWRSIPLNLDYPTTEYAMYSCAHDSSAQYSHFPAFFDAEDPSHMPRHFPIEPSDPIEIDPRYTTGNPHGGLAYFESLRSFAPRFGDEETPSVSVPSKRKNQSDDDTDDLKPPKKLVPGPRPRIKAQPKEFVPARIRRTADDRQKGFQCREPGCINTFPDQVSLEMHTKKKHMRPYMCAFRFAGCGSTFAGKNEWKRHIGSEHLRLYYWICREGECSKTSDGSNPDGRKTTDKGAIFNRKDLYTQHMRRVHMPESIKAQYKSTVGTAFSAAAEQWGEHLRQSGDAALRKRCHLPQHMICPAESCEMEFRGPDAWDQRMEHVSRHLDRAARGDEPKVVIGGEHDELFVKWASEDNVRIIVRSGGQWVLASKIDGESPPRKESTALESVVPPRIRKAEGIVFVKAEEEEDDCPDAEGEPDDEA